MRGPKQRPQNAEEREKLGMVVSLIRWHGTAFEVEARVVGCEVRIKVRTVG